MKAAHSTARQGGGRWQLGCTAKPSVCLYVCMSVCFMPVQARPATGQEACHICEERAVMREMNRGRSGRHRHQHPEGRALESRAHAQHTRARALFFLVLYSLRTLCFLLHSLFRVVLCAFFPLCSLPRLPAGVFGGGFLRRRVGLAGLTLRLLAVLAAAAAALLARHFALFFFAFFSWLAFSA